MTGTRWRRMWVGGPDGERGAVAVAVALLFPLLIGAAALAVDTAAVWNARAQVLSGADAAALAEAFDCAEGDCGTQADVKATMEHYWLRNNDGAKLASLQPGTGWIQWDTGQRATRSQGTWNIEHYFGAALGVPDVALTVVSMARWAGLASATADLPLAVSWCAFQSTSRPGIGSTRSTTTLTLGTTDTTSCAGPSGGTVTGPATVLTAATSACTTSSAAAQTVTTATAVPASCSVAYLSGLVGQDVTVPVYDQSTGNGTRVYGYAALHVTAVSTGSPATVSGYWNYAATQIDTPDALPTAPDLGARAVFLWDPDDWQGTRCPC